MNWTHSYSLVHIVNVEFTFHFIICKRYKWYVHVENGYGRISGNEKSHQGMIIREYPVHTILITILKMHLYALSIVCWNWSWKLVPNRSTFLLSAFPTMLQRLIRGSKRELQEGWTPFGLTGTHHCGNRGKGEVKWCTRRKGCMKRVKGQGG